ncbi:hypothetical protein MK542_09965, partial [Streptococcus cristatus]|nr:hypothetical protein [Streptococcus cristatus]
SIRFFLMMVWSLFIIGLMGLFFYNKIGSIIPAVDLPTTEIIEPYNIKGKPVHSMDWFSFTSKIF